MPKGIRSLKRFNKAQMLELIAEWGQSNLPKKTFCKQHNLAPSVLHYWFKKLNPPSHTSSASPSSAFIPIELTYETPVLQ